MTGDTPRRPAERRLMALDGLRGVAALCVMVFHVCQWFVPEKRILAGCTLAVDFFFCLSGFVLAHAFNHRLTSSMTVFDFLLSRLRRLYPLLAAGFLLAALFAFARWSAHKPELAALTPGVILRSLGLSLLLIPNEAPAVGFGMFPLDAPAWSLFYEIAVNIAFACVLRRLGMTLSRCLFAAVVLASLLFALGHVTIEQGFTLQSWRMGVARVCLSFLTGVLLQNLLSALGPTLRLDADRLFLPMAACMVALFLVEGSHQSLGWEILCVLLLFPGLVALGSVTETRRLTGLCHVLGELSYPLYIMHAPTIFIAASIGIRLPWFHGTRDPALLACTCVLAVIVAWLTLVLYDRPMRARLSGRRTARRGGLQAQPAAGS